MVNALHLRSADGHQHPGISPIPLRRSAMIQSMNGYQVYCSISRFCCRGWVISHLVAAKVTAGRQPRQPSQRQSMATWDRGWLQHMPPSDYVPYDRQYNSTEATLLCHNKPELSQQWANAVSIGPMLAPFWLIASICHPQIAFYMTDYINPQEPQKSL